jgi:hypothetical protein
MPKFRVSFPVEVSDEAKPHALAIQATVSVTVPAETGLEAARLVAVNIERAVIEMNSLYKLHQQEQARVTAHGVAMPPEEASSQTR